MENVGDRIKAFRESRSLTQKDIFQATGGEIKQTSLSAIENNQAKPGFDTLTALLNAYPELSSDWLIRGEGPMYKRGAELTPVSQLPPQVPSEAPAAPGTLRRNREGEGGSYWEAIAQERLARIQNLEQTVERLWGQNTDLLKKPEASADAADLYKTVDEIASEHRFSSVEMPDIARFVPTSRPRPAVHGFRLGVA